MKSADGPASIRIERTLAASVERVFAAWTRVDVLRRWWHGEHDWETPHAELDIRVGGPIRIRQNSFDNLDAALGA